MPCPTQRVGWVCAVLYAVHSVGVCRAAAPAPPGAAPRAPAALLGTLPAALGWQELAAGGRGGFKCVLTVLSPSQSLLRGLSVSHCGWCSRKA